MMRLDEKLLTHSVVERLRSGVFDALPAQIALLGGRGEILAVNRRWLEFAAANGLDGSESFWVGRNYLETCDRAGEHGCQDAYKVALGIRDVLSGCVRSFELEYPCHSSSEQRWFRLMVSPCCPEDGWAVVMHINVTERVLAEEAVRETKEAALGQAARFRILSDNAARLLVHQNPQELMETLFESLSAALGLEVYFNFLVDPAEHRLVLVSCSGVSQAFQEQIQYLEFGQAVCGTVALNQERIVVHDVQGTGDERSAAIRSIGVTAYACHPLQIGDRLLGTLSFGSRRRNRFEPEELELMQAISDQAAAALERSRLTAKLLESTRAAEEARRAAEEANQTKDDFLAALSHELRTPLTPVLLLAQRIERDPRLADELRPEIARIRRNVELEARLIDDLLDLTRITRGKIELRPEEVDLHALLKHSAETCVREAGHIRIVFELEAEQHWTWGDAARLEQVFWNLLSNAVKFTGPGGEIRIATRNPGPGSVQVKVADTGIGIEPHVLPHIFSTFEQGGSHITRHFGGLGLGLPISKNLIELHDGSIEAASDGSGQGAVFTVTLGTVQAPSGSRSGEGPEPLLESSLHILVVEDHADTAEAMRDLLTARGHRITVARSTAEALAVVAACSTDGGAVELVVSDLGLPDGTGYELMRELADRYGLNGIAVSGYGMERDLSKSREAGFAQHLTKPVNLRSLEEAIRRAAAASR